MLLTSIAHYNIYIPHGITFSIQYPAVWVTKLAVGICEWILLLYLEGGDKSREDGSERSVGGFRLAREHVSDAGEDGGRKQRV